MLTFGYLTFFDLKQKFYICYVILAELIILKLYTSLFKFVQSWQLYASNRDASFYLHLISSFLETWRMTPPPPNRYFLIWIFMFASLFKIDFPIRSFKGIPIYIRTSIHNLKTFMELEFHSFFSFPIEKTSTS